MKTIVLILLMTFSALAYAQNDLSQEQTDSSKNIVLLKNGESIEFSRISGVFGKKLSLELEKPKKEKSAGKRLGNYFGGKIKNTRNIAISDIEKISLAPDKNSFTNKKDETFSFTKGKILKFKKRMVYAVELVSGQCSLYFYQVPNSNNGYHFLVKRKGEEAVTELHGMSGSASKFKGVGPKYFTDCSEVVKKINESDAMAKWQYLVPEFTRFVTTYNESCGNADAR